ncbi:MAG: hypothetical protein CL607_11130 [Anaerolineaceae bacterium]|nr:hypothetical protein [Anaerolineaceae bacterium]
MTEPMEKAKRKGKPRVDRYSQNEAFAIIVFSLTVMLFFRLDVSLGAIAFKSRWGWGYDISYVLILAFIIFFWLMRRWDILSTWHVLARIFAIVCGGLVSMFTIPIAGFLLSGLGSTAENEIDMLLVALIGATIAMWFVAKFRELTLPRNKMKVIALSACVVSIALCNGSRAYGNQAWGSRGGLFLHTSTSTHNYYAIYYAKPGALIFEQMDIYECDLLSLNCEKVHRILPKSYNSTSSYQFIRHDRIDRRPYHQVVELVTGDNDNALLLVEDVVRFDSSEDGE